MKSRKINRVFYKLLLTLLFHFLINCIAVELSTTILQVSDGETKNISLRNYNKSDTNDQAFTQLMSIKGNANFAIEVTDIPSQVSFIIIQTHVHIYNVSMSDVTNAISKTPKKFVTGANIGLLIETDGLTTAKVNVSNENSFEINSLIAIVAYTRMAPYPGGCNMEFEIEKSPFQKLVYDSATVTVDAQPASVPKIGKVQPICEKYSLQHDAYRMYMVEQDFTNETYFSAIANMLTVRDIQKNADLIPASLFGSTMRRVYSLYPGTGSVYSMVAHFANHSSAYVPIVTYGCDISSGSFSCSTLTTTFTKILCAVTFFLGLLITMRGQYYFKMSMILIGWVIGGYIGYAVGSTIGSFDFTAIMITSMTLGALTSLIWLIFWVTLSSPIPSLILSGLALGSFFFYVFYFTIPVGLLYLEINAYYWLIYTSFVILAILIFSVIPLAGNILCFTGLGAYATVLSIDYYSESNLKYILINSIRRTTVSNFNVAVIEPPYQDKDILLTAFWVFLVILGLYKQCATNWNRAPFPPSTPSLMRDSEDAPLLGGERYRSRYTSFNSQRYRRDS